MNEWKEDITGLAYEAYDTYRERPGVQQAANEAVVSNCVAATRI